MKTYYSSHQYTLWDDLKLTIVTRKYNGLLLNVNVKLD